MDIKKVIKAHNLTSEVVAKRIGIAKTTFSTTINGNPTVKMLERIAAAIGCDITEFFDNGEIIDGFVDVNGQLIRIKKANDVVQVVSTIKNALSDSEKAAFVDAIENVLRD